MNLPNVIIAGSPKTGTTSVFRYLASHPDVCPSSIKEIHFFEEFLDNITEETLEKYKNYFKSCSGKEKVRLEASPRYMQGGTPVARAMYKYVPDAKLVFIIREPIERFISRYISLVTKTDRIPEHYHNLDKLVDEAISHKQANPDPENPKLDDEIVEYLWQGCYAAFIQEFINIYGHKNICLLFFDDLKYHPKKFMQNFCDFAGIDRSYFDNYQFRVENKTRVVRFRSIHKLAEKLNRKLEFIQNKFPSLRQFIKKVYYTVLNPESKNNNIVDTTYAKQALKEYYKPHNAHLKSLITSYYNEYELPAWLSKDY